MNGGPKKCRKLLQTHTLLQYYTKATIIRSSRVKELILCILAHQKVSAMEPSLTVINETCVYLFFHVNMAALKKVDCFHSLK